MNADAMSEGEHLIEVVKTANSANRYYGDLKYWLSDLASSLLMRSEREVNAAQVQMEGRLSELHSFDPERVTSIRADVENMMRYAYQAVDAHTKNERVLGNSHMAKAQKYIMSIDRHLEQIAANAEMEFQSRAQAMHLEAVRVTDFAILLFASFALIGLVVTFVILRSITRPLQELDAAITSIAEGDLSAAVPDEGSSEIGKMANTLELFRQSLVERTRLSLERERAEEERGAALIEARRANQAKSEFLANMSHELRTPLTASLGSLGLILSVLPPETPDQAKELIEIAKRNNEALLRLVNELLDYEKVLAGQLEIETGPYDVCELISNNLTDNEGLARAQSVDFVFAGSATPLFAQVNEYRFQQVLNNLLSNAAKFSAIGSRVEVSVEKVGQMVCLKVKDYGAGIPEDFKSKIFEQFTQADSSATRQHGGTGLGLSISKVLIEGMGGEIDFSSQVGVGTEFYVTFRTAD